MALIKLDLTDIKVNKELDVLTFVHPKFSYRVLLNNPEFRKNLSNYILKTLPSQYLLIESQKDFYKVRETIECTPQERKQIYNLVNQRLNDLRNSKRTVRFPRIDYNAQMFYYIN